jgi:hypothetical protein
MSIKVACLRTEADNAVVEQFKQAFGDDIVTVPISPQSPSEVTEQTADAAVTLLNGVRPIIMDAMDAGRRFVVFDAESGKLMEVADIQVTFKEFQP